MCSPSRLPVLISVCVIALILLGGTPVHGKKSKKKEAGESEGKGICANVSCTKAPDGLICTRTAIKNPSLLKRLGNLKDCCPAWRCQDTDGSYSTYFGMSGDATSDSFNGEAEQYKDGKGEQNDKCVEAKAVCPKPDGNDKCVESNTTEATEFKPKGDLDSCCPTYNCTKADGSYHIHFAMTGGTLPEFTDANAVAKEKGEATGDKNCSNIVCAPKPESPDDGPHCKPTTTDDSTRIRTLGPFRECCNVWKCEYDDGSYYVHFELQAPSFWVADTSFYSELPEVPGDGVTIVYDESEEVEPETLPPIMTTQPTPSSADGEDEESEEEEEVVAPPVHRAFKPKRHHKKRRKQTKMDQSSAQILTVIVNNGNNGVNATLGPDWKSGNQAQVITSQDPSAPDSSRVVMVTSDQGTPGGVQASGVSQQYQSYQYQEQYQQQQPAQQYVGQDPNSAQMQSLQAMNMQQMQQMQTMNMQNMQNLQNMNNAQMQAMMAQQNGGMGGPPMY